MRLFLVWAGHCLVDWTVLVVLAVLACTHLVVLLVVLLVVSSAQVLMLHVVLLRNWVAMDVLLVLHENTGVRIINKDWWRFSELHLPRL